MRIPDSLAALLDDGIIDQVLRPLMSGKEAQVYLVLSGGVERVAKVYKDAQQRTFQNRAEYTEGRKVRNTRDQRAMAKRTRHGRARDEAAWRTTEVDMIYRLRSAGVRVPAPHHFIDGVLIMELVVDADGHPAPRLGELSLTPEQARDVFRQLLSEVVRMLAAGVVHGDLSEFNVLMAADGPVIIDFPQAVDAASNQNARKLLMRDVENLHRHLSRHVPDYVALPYAQEMWQLYERNQLTPDTKLRGAFRGSAGSADARAVLGLIGDAARDERRRREALGLSMRGAAPVQPRRAEARMGEQRRGQQSQAPQRTVRPEVDLVRPQRPSEQGEARSSTREPRPVQRHSHPALPSPGKAPERRAAESPPGMGNPAGQASDASKRRRRRRRKKRAQ